MGGRPAAFFRYNMTMEKIRLGISSCLLGERVRYDGGHKLDYFLKNTLGNFVEWVPVCPEVESGLPVPREALRLVGSVDDPRLVTTRSGIDHTERIRQWATGRLRRIEREELCGFIFKSRSPSSGLRGVKVYPLSGAPNRSGTGIFARAFMERFPLLPIEDDGRLHDPLLRENFVERVFVFRRGRELLKKGGMLRDLVAFHTEHKLLILSHSPSCYRILGSIVANAKKQDRDKGVHEYLGILMEGLRLTATVKKNTNVLQHIAGYFKKNLSPDEKKELIEIIGHYHKGYIPLIVPITLINHFVRKFDNRYLERQHYLHPHPIELMLRNHA